MKVTLTNPARPAVTRVNDAELGTFFYTTDPRSLFLKAYGVVVDMVTGKTHPMRIFKEVDITPVTVEELRIRRVA